MCGSPSVEVSELVDAVADLAQGQEQAHRFRLTSHMVIL